jgi:hypothetical protein
MREKSDSLRVRADDVSAESGAGLTGEAFVLSAQRAAALNHPQQHDDDRHDEQDVHKSPNGR